MINRSGGEKDSITAPNLITEQATSDAEVAISVPTTSVPADMDASLSTTNSKAVDNTIPHNTSIVHANEVSTSSEHLSFEANKSTDAPPILSEKPDDPGHTGESTRNDGNLNDNHPQNPAKQHEPMGEEPMGDKPMGDETKQKEIKQQASDSHGESDVADDENDDDPFAGLDEVATLDLHSISNYTFGKKGTKSKSKSMSDMSSRLISNALQNDYERRGLRRSVRAVILVHEHNFAHLLLLQRSDGKGEFALPGGRLRAGENFEQGLLRKLSAKLCPDESISHGTDGKNKEDEYMTDNPSLEVGDKLGKWYAIDFSRRYFPYVPAHVSKVKEEVHLFTVALPSKFVFAVPNNLQLIAVPLCDVHSNASTYGAMIGAVPALMSRFDVNFC